MSEQINAEVVTENPTTEEPELPSEEPEAQIEDETAPTPSLEPEPPLEGPSMPVDTAEATPPEVEATVGHDLNSGKYLVSIVTRHPDPTVVSVNGKAVWEGVG